MSKPTDNLQIYNRQSQLRLRGRKKQDTASSSHQLFELVLEMVRRGQERGELQTTAMAEAMTLILLSTYFYTFINWLEMENPPQLSQMLQTHLNVLLDGMKPSR